MKNIKDYLNEGLIDGFKRRSQITKVQGAVEDICNKLLEEKPKQYNNGKSLLDAVKEKAIEFFEKTVTVEGTISAEEWWKTFSKSMAHMYDVTVFNEK